MLRRSKRRRTAILLFVQSVKIRGLKSLFFIAVALSFYHPNLNPLSQKKEGIPHHTRYPRHTTLERS